MLTPEELLGGAVVRSPGKRLDKDAGGGSADRFFDSRLEKGGRQECISNIY
jgi:hypothetical protein